MRRPKDSKSSSCTETAEVYVAGISVEVSAQYPGRSPAVSRRAGLAHSKGCDDAGGEVSRGHSSRAIDEGLNRLKTASAGFQKLIGQLRRKTATGRRCGTDSREICLGGYSQPGACATKQGSTEPPDTWTVRPVVWEDGGGNPSASYPIAVLEQHSIVSAK
jgi:hypothetical protein